MNNVGTFRVRRNVNRSENLAPVSRKQGTPLLYLLGFVMALFLGILIFAYAVTKRANPVYLDEHGKPTAVSQSHDH
ncbi:MAG TPA: hypothetical protein VFA68_22110 [Terriglobales bacterium]|nr:hypothetical protein [Terriglobales bacterium]